MDQSWWTGLTHSSQYIGWQLLCSTPHMVNTIKRKYLFIYFLQTRLWLSTGWWRWPVMDQVCTNSLQTQVGFFDEWLFEESRKMKIKLLFHSLSSLSTQNNNGKKKFLWKKLSIAREKVVTFKMVIFLIFMIYIDGNAFWAQMRHFYCLKQR